MNRDKTLAIIIKLKDEASKQAKRLGAALKGMLSTIKTVAKGAALIAGLGVAIGLMAQKGDELIALRSSFKTLAAGVGENADEMLSAMQTATSGLVSNAELIEKANNAILLGLPVTTESMAEMSEAAVVLGRAMGIDATSALDSMILGLGRQSKMILDNLGITVDAAKANEVYAQELGKTANELTDAERKQAFFNITMDAATKKVKELGGVVLGFGGQVAVAKTQIVNFKDEVFAFTSVIGDQLLNAFVNATGGIKDFGTELKFNAKVATEFVKTVAVGMVKAFGFLSKAGDRVTKVFAQMQKIWAGFGEAIARWTGADNVDEFVRSGEAAQIVINDLDASIADTDKTTEAFVNSIRDINFKDVEAGMAGVGRETGKAADEAARLNKEQEAAAAAAAAAAKAQEEAAKAAAKAAADASKAAADAFLTEFEGGIPALSRDEMIATATAFADQLGAELPDLGIMATEDIKSIALALESASDTASKKYADNINDLVSGVAAGLSDPGGAINDALGVGISGAVLASTGIPIDPEIISQLIGMISKDLPAQIFSGLTEWWNKTIVGLPVMLGNIIPDLIVPLLKEIPRMIDKFVDNLDPLTDKILDEMPALADAFMTAMISPEMMTLLFRVYFSMYTSLFDRIFPGVRARIGEAIRVAANNFMQFFAELFQTQLPIFMEALAASLGNVLTVAFANVVAEIAAWWQRTIWKDLTEGLGLILTNLAAQFAEQILTPLAEMFSMIVQQIGEAILLFAAQFAELITLPFVNAVAEAWEGFAGGMQSAWEQTFGLLPAMAESVGRTIAGPLGQVAEQLAGIKIGGGGAVERFTGIRFHEGTPFVPRTGMFELQRGERVVSAADNAMAGAGAGGGSITINVNPSAGMNEESLAVKVAAAVKANTRGLGDQVRRTVERQSN